jgi:hypothetical protein
MAHVVSLAIITQKRRRPNVNILNAMTVTQQTDQQGRGKWLGYGKE